MSRHLIGSGKNGKGKVRGEDRKEGEKEKEEGKIGKKGGHSFM